MLECRYYANCYFMECDVPDKCDGNGNCESYRHGHEIKTACQFYSPMPDVESLLALAKVLHSMGEQYDAHERYELGLTFRAIAKRIREALGVEGL